MIMKKGDEITRQQGDEVTTTQVEQVTNEQEVKVTEQPAAEVTPKKSQRKRNTIIVIVLLILALLVYLLKGTVLQVYHSLFDERTEIGHVMLSDLAKTEKLTVLSLYKEVIVSQYREEPRMFYGTRLYQIHSVYPGRIDVGFDLTKCSDDWLMMREDTAYVKLPAVEILNQGGWYIDETSRETPIEEGTWTNEDYARLSHRANALLKRNCELDDCYHMAESNGRRVVDNLLKAMGIKFVKIEIEERDYYKPFTVDIDGTGQNRVHYDFYVANGNRYVKFADDSMLYYKGDFDDESLYSVIDMFSYFTRNKASRQWNITKQGHQLTIAIINATLSKGSSAAEAFIRSRRPGDVSRLSAALKQLFGEDLQLTITEVDRRGAELYKY